MKNKTKALTGILASGALVFAGVYWSGADKATEPADAPAKQDAAKAEAMMKTQSVMGNISIAKAEDDRKVRDYKFQKKGAVIEAEGIKITAPGKMEVSSQVTPGTLKQELTHASFRLNGKAIKKIERNPIPEAYTTHDGKKGRVKYDDFYSGIGLEYVYDGKDVEEFYHLSDTVKQDLIKSGADLHLSALFPGLSVDQGAMFTEVGTPTNTEGLWGMPDGQGGEIRPESDRVTDAELELTIRQHRFVLPKAIAFDSTGKKLELQRELKWRDDGLRVAVNLPNAWVKEAQGQIVIDPSIIDNTRASHLSSYQEKNIVRDSTNRIHVVYRGIHNGVWTPMYTSGTGSNWDTPTPIRTTHYAGVSNYYTPSIVIDGLDRLHVVFSDYGNIPDSTEKVAAGFQYPGWGYTGYYARCDNACASRTWTDPFAATGGEGGGLLPGTANRYQYYFDMAVDQNNDVYITYREDGAGRATVAYKVTATGFSALAGLGDAYLSQNIVVNSANQVLFVGGEYYNEMAMKIYELNNGTWLLRDKLVPRIRTGMSVDSGASYLGTNDGNLRHYRLSSTIDKNDYLHILAEVKDEWHKDKWRMMYYEFNPTTSNSQSYNTAYTSANGGSEGQLRHLWVFPYESPADHVNHPSITVDEGANSGTPKVHAFWWRNADPSPYVEYASLVRGASAFSAPSRFLTSTEAQSAPKVRPRVVHPAQTNDTAYCDGTTPPCTHPNAEVKVASGTALIDMLVVLGTSDLRYISTGQPVEEPSLKTPQDHSYTQLTTPTLTWNKIPSDTGSNGIVYDLQVDTTPLFNSNSGSPLISHDDLGVDNKTLVTSLTDGSFYYWRVRADGPHGAGPWSSIFEIGVDNTAPGAFDLLSPANNSDPGTKTPTFTWEAASD